MPLTQVDQGLLGQYAQYTGFKNRILNGSMAIDQRNAGASVSNNASRLYTLDRWASLGSSGSKFTIQQTPSATETGYATRVAAGFTNYLAVTSSAATTVNAGDYYTMEQRIEGFNVADLAWGTANAKTVTISFWVYSSLTGTFGGSVVNSAQNRSYPFTYTISATNTWEQKTITVAGDQSGTWLTTNGIGIDLIFGLGVGSTYSATAGSWTGSLAFSATGATNVVSTNAATWYITGVQLEKGSTATSFDYRPYSTELALCQRYLPMICNGSADRFTAYITSITAAQINVGYQVQPRVAPTGLYVSSNSHFTLYSYAGGAGGSPTSIVLGNAGLNSLQFQTTTTAGSPTISAGQATLFYPNTASALMYATGCEL